MRGSEKYDDEKKKSSHSVSRQKAEIKGGILFSVAAFFILLCILIFLSELLDMPFHLLHAPPTPFNWRESVFEIIIIIGSYVFLRMRYFLKERIKAINALEVSKEKYRRLIEMANDAIFLTDAETGIEPQSRRTLGCAV